MNFLLLGVYYLYDCFILDIFNDGICDDLICFCYLMRSCKLYYYFFVEKGLIILYFVLNIWNKGRYSKVVNLVECEFIYMW